MTEPPRTMQERLRNHQVDQWVSGSESSVALCNEAADALDAQSNLLAAAREALEPFAKFAERIDVGVAMHWRKPLAIEEVNRMAPTQEVRERQGRA